MVFSRNRAVRQSLPSPASACMPSGIKRFNLSTRSLSISIASVGLLYLLFISLSSPTNHHQLRLFGSIVRVNNWSSKAHLINAIAARLSPSKLRLNSDFNRTLSTETGFSQKDLLSFLSANSSIDTSWDDPFGIQMVRHLNEKQCTSWFPNLYHELERSIEYHNRSQRSVTLKELDEATLIGNGRVLIYENRVYVKHYKSARSRTTAILNSIQEAVITSTEPLPNIEFVIHTGDIPEGETGSKYPLWALDRLDDGKQDNLWLMPDFGFYSWPEPKVGGMIEVRDKTIQVERKLRWQDKLGKAFWRGAILNDLRRQLLDLTKNQAWSDVEPIVWSSLGGRLKKPEEHCLYKYVVQTEGAAYSGRLKYLQMCRSIVVSHPLQYVQHFHHLLDPQPHSPTQNIAITPGPGFEGIHQLMEGLMADEVWAESIANNSVRLFRHYLSPAGVSCYWRQLFRSWAKVQGFEPVRREEDTPFESFNLLHVTEWKPSR